MAQPVLPGIASGPAVIRAMNMNNKARISYMIREHPTMFVRSVGDTVLADSNLSTRVLNIAMGGDFSVDTSIEDAHKILEYYTCRRLQFALWLGPLSDALEKTHSNLLKAGYRKDDEVLVGMVANLSDTVATASSYPPPTNLTIVSATTAKHMHDYGQVINSVFPPPPYDGYCDFAAFNADMAQYIDLKSFPYRIFVGYVDGKPIATSATMLEAGVAGIYDIVTRPEYQRRGYAALMMQAVLDEARSHGYKVTTLLASKMGRGVYAKLGYQEVGEWHIWNDATVGV